MDFHKVRIDCGGATPACTLPRCAWRDVGESPVEQVWSHRPSILHLGIFFAAYLLGCGIAELLGIVPGTNIAIWAPGGVFIATLIMAPPYSWPWWIIAGGAAELLAQFLWYHSPLPAGVVMYGGNALEAVTGAWLVNRTCRRPVRLETLQGTICWRS